MNERYKTWNMLRGIVGVSNLPWVAMGDFNEVIHAHEHDGVGQRSQAQMDAFRDTLDICGLSDLGYTGINWTFEKKVAGGTYTRVRLDRCVATPEWLLAFPNAAVEHKVQLHLITSQYYYGWRTCIRACGPHEYSDTKHAGKGTPRCMR